MEIDLLSEGFKFMVLGMVTVFVFLVVMVIILHFQSKIINKYFPEKKVAVPNRQSALQPKQQDNKALVAAITAAITTFKNSKEGK